MSAPVMWLSHGLLLSTQLILFDRLLYHIVCKRLVEMKRALVGIAFGTLELLLDVAMLAERGVIQPTID